jgi:NTP pyrophosphatase (non-canonical NTP hydrolase)
MLSEDYSLASWRLSRADHVNLWAQEVYNSNQDKGFWDKRGSQDDNTFLVAAKLALIHSEVSEALEEWRKVDYSFKAMEEELADVMIRVLDLAGYLCMPIGQAIEDKLEANRNRPYKHGKEF